MKTNSILCTALTSLILSVADNSQALTFASSIAEISPAQALVGQTITVRIETPILQINPAYKAAMSDFTKRFRRGIAPGTGGTSIPRIFFTGANSQQTVEGQNVVSLGSNRYSVRVPNEARSGKLRLQSGLLSSLSTVNFTVVSAGYSVTNLSQFNVVSVKVDGVERLAGLTVPAVLASNPTVFTADIGATAGNHAIEVTIGRSINECVMVYSLPAVQATSPTNGLEITTLLTGEYLTATPHAAVSGSSLTASWQTTIITTVADGSPSGVSVSASTNGFDFTFNAASGATNWTNWVGTRNNVIASGRVNEPTSWLLNPAATLLQLARPNGTVYATITLNFLNKTILNPLDNNTYEMQ